MTKSSLTSIPSIPAAGENPKAAVLSFRVCGLDGLLNVLDPAVLSGYRDSVFTELRRSLAECGGVPDPGEGPILTTTFDPGITRVRYCLQAVECALQLAVKFRLLTGELRERGIDVYCRAGIAWGPVSDSTNRLSSALEEAAGRDGLLVSPEIAGMTCDRWNWELFDTGTKKIRALHPVGRKDPVGAPAFTPDHPLYRSLMNTWEGFLREGTGASGGVAIIGDPGLGKNTMAEEYAAFIAGSTERVVICSGFNREGQPPMGMWFVIGGERARPGGEHLPLWLAGALRELAGTNRRAIVLIRDVHCADDVSLKVLSRLLVMPPEGLSLFFILVGDHLPDQLPANRLNVVKPSPMNRTEIRAFIESALTGPKDVGLGDALAFTLHKSTMGYPMFVHHTLLYMVSSGILAKGADGIWRLERELTGIPPSVEAVLHSRIDCLAPELRSGLQLAGLLGRSFQRELFLNVHDEFFGRDGEPILEGLSRTGFLSIHGSSCHFLGSLLAGAAESLLNGESAVRMHGLAAERLADGRSPGPGETAALETANHFAGADRHREALPWALAALDQMVAAGDCRGGLQLHARIRDWPLGEPDSETSRRLTMASFELHALKGCFLEAFDAFNIVYPLARPEDIPKLMSTKARILAERGETLPAVAILEKLLAESDPDGETRASVLCRLSKLFAHLGNMVKSREYQDRALDLIAKRPELMECIIGNMAMTRLIAGDTVKAEELCRMALDSHRYGGNLKHKASLLGALAIIALRTGREDEGMELSSAAAEIHRRSGNMQGLCGVLGNTGSMLARSGRLEPALEALHEALEMARHIGNADMVANFTQSMGNIFTIMGRLDEAEAHFTESLSTAETMGNSRMMASALTGLGSMKLVEGSLDEAERHFTRAVRMHHRSGNISGEAHSMSGLAEVHLRRGEPERALAPVKEAQTLAVACGDIQSSISIRFLEARILLARGMVHEAIDAYRDSCRDAGEHGITVGGMETRSILERELSVIGLQMENTADR